MRRSFSITNVGIERNGDFFLFPLDVRRSDFKTFKIIEESRFFINGYELMENGTFVRTALAFFYMIF